MVLGVCITMLLFAGPVRIPHGISLDSHTFLVGAIAILIGIQSLTFGLIAQRFAVRYQLLPQSSWNYRLASFLTFERGLVVAISVIGLGTARLHLVSPDLGFRRVRAPCRSHHPESAHHLPDRNCDRHSTRVHCLPRRHHDNSDQARPDTRCPGSGLIGNHAGPVASTLVTSERLFVEMLVRLFCRLALTVP